MKDLPARLSELRRALVTLSRDDFDGLARGHLKLAGADPAVGELDQWRMALYEWLRHLGFVSDHQARLVLNRVGPLLEEALAGGGPDHPRHLVIAERRWVFWSRAAGLDLVTEEGLGEWPGGVVTTFGCELVNLRRRLRGRVRHNRRGEGDGHRPADAGA